jgi:pimeloyl-ACP methyl ester carboxylesterase
MIDGFAIDVRAAIDERAIDRAMVFGYSMGGYVALKVAADYPDRVLAVATFATKLAWSPEIAIRERSRLDPVAIRAKLPKFAAALEERHAGAGGWESVLEKTSGMMRELGDKPVVDDVTIARLSSPACLMVGDRDNVVTVDETAAASRSMPRGELAVLPNTTHPLEQVRIPVLASLLRDFFARATE